MAGGATTYLLSQQQNIPRYDIGEWGHSPLPRVCRAWLGMAIARNGIASSEPTAIFHVQ